MIRRRIGSNVAHRIFAMLWLTLALWLVSIMAPSFALAQTDDTETPAETDTNQAATNDEREPEDQPETETAEEAPQDQEINPDASFTPTEEISEDKPVAFPVDI